MTVDDAVLRATMLGVDMVTEALEKSKQERIEAMPEKTEHTPTPWELSGFELDGKDCWGFEPKGSIHTVAAIVPGKTSSGIIPDKQHAANAEFILCAVNSHDELVAALEALQFFRHEENGVPYCPACLRHKPEGHDKFCMIGKALANARPKGEKS